MIPLEEIRKQNDILRSEIKEKEQVRLYKIERRKLKREKYSLTIQNKAYPIFWLGKGVAKTGKLAGNLCLVVFAGILALFIGIANGVQ